MLAKSCLLLILYLHLNILYIQGVPCQKRDYGHGSFVCVCNATYCDDANFSPPVSLDSVLVYTSSKTSLRFNRTVVKKNTELGVDDSDILTINILRENMYQRIKGFGGALTDSASINIKSLSPAASNNLLRTYFASSGIEYNLIRIPMASCDYSTREYTYLDTKNDFNLSTFALAKEDMEYKIPLLKSILAVNSSKLSLYASPWTAPAWMKTNGKEIGRGTLKGSPGDKYHKTWAQYFVKFFDSYKSHGINFWGFTVQNEPSNGRLVRSTWQSTGWSAEHQRDFIKTDLGPAMEHSEYRDLKMMILDDQRLFMPSFIEKVCNDADAAKYVSGVGVHWYWNWLIPPSVMQATHEKFPSKFMLATEACNKNHPADSLGSWDDGVKYSNDILDVLNNWGVGWVDWNMCLNLEGGPNWAKNYDNSPIIVNSTADEFYKQPMFYHMGHFSKFIKEGFSRIHASADKNLSDFKFVVTKSDDGVFAIVVLNTADKPRTICVQSGSESFKVVVPANSIQTLNWI